MLLGSVELLPGSVGVTRHLRASEMTGEGLVAASSCEQACAASGSPVKKGDKQRCESVGIFGGTPQRRKPSSPPEMFS